MKFYKLTYDAITEIKRKSDEFDDSFITAFSGMADDILDSSSGYAQAFIYNYTSQKIDIVAYVKDGNIEQWLDIISPYLPSNICNKAKVDEITFENFKRFIHSAARMNELNEDDIWEITDLKKLVYGGAIEFFEDFIEQNPNNFISESLSEELKRIQQSGKPKILYNPVHYIIGGNSYETREIMLNKLLFELKMQDRIYQSRYATIQISENGYLSKSRAPEEIDELMRISNSGAIVFDIDIQTRNPEDIRSNFDTVFDLIFKACKKYRRETLCIFLLHDNNRRSATMIHNRLPELDFVEIMESPLDAEKARNYLFCRTKFNRVRANQMLYSEIEDGNTYYADELNSIYDKWYKKHIVQRKFPQYKEFFEEAEAKKVSNKAEDEKGDAYAELMSMVGLKQAKDLINSAIDYFKAQTLFADNGFVKLSPSMHMVFTGAPGTAKTTVARLFAKIMKDNEILTSGEFVEVGRSDLVGKYVGWTAKAVKEKFKEAQGGVLFIDEAYSLVDDRNGSFGDEAINTIVQEMENNRNNVIVIFAGYPDKMEAFLKKNPGLRSRIAFHIPFEDYSKEELVEIAQLIAENNDLILGNGVKEKMLSIMERALTQEDFGNGRFARNLIEKARMKQATRLIHSNKKIITREQIATLIPEDFEMPILNTKPTEEKKVIGF